jgi:hypothetical protein
LRIAGGAHGVVGEFHQSVVGHADDALARVALRCAKGVELLEVEAGDAGLLLEFAAGGFFEALVDADEAAGQRPAHFVGALFALDEQDLQVGLVVAEHDAVNGDGGMRIFVGVGHGGEVDGWLDGVCYYTKASLKVSYLH